MNKFTKEEIKNNNANFWQNMDSTFEPDTVEEQLKELLLKLFFPERIKNENVDIILNNKHVKAFMIGKDIDETFVSTVVENF